MSKPSFLKKHVGLKHCMYLLLFQIKENSRFSLQNHAIELPGSLLICEASRKLKLIGIASNSEDTCQSSSEINSCFKKYYPLDELLHGEWYQEFGPARRNNVKKHLKPVWSRTKLNLENTSSNHLISSATLICLFKIFF